MTWSVYICMLLLLLLPLQVTSSPLEQERSIRSVLNVPDPANNFTHIAVYDQDTIFVGGTNYIYRVSTENLGIEKLEKIGPNPSNSIGQDCYNDNSCDKNVNNTNVKVLLIYKSKTESIGELIICTSLDKGTCEKRHPTTLAVNIRYPESVVSVTDSNVAFLAPGPSSNRSSPKLFLYVASSLRVPSSTGPKQTLPLFCSRNITTFEILSDKSYVDQTYWTSFHIQYIYGFSSGIYSYVISIQRSIKLGVIEYFTKIHRVCQTDRKFNSYAEAHLHCLFRNSNIKMLIVNIQAAYVGKPGRFLAKSLNVSTDDDVLFGIFGSDVPGEIVEESYLCMIPMNRAETLFGIMTQRCFNGRGTTGPAHVTKQQPCIKSNTSIGNDYCGEFDFNNPINTLLPIESFDAIKLNITASSLTVAVTYKGDTVAIIATQSGELKKIRIQTETQAEEYETVNLDVGLPILNITFFDKKYLLLLTPKKLIKVEVEMCDQYEACDDCLRHPFCGWSFQPNSCFFVDDVTKSNISVTTCPTVSFIKQTSDLSTRPHTISLALENLPQFHGLYECVYTGYGTELQTSSERISEDEITCVIPPKENISLFTSISDCFGFNLSVLINNASVLSTFVKFFRCDLPYSLCPIVKCTVHGFWSSFDSFGDWSNCSKSCGGGIKNRKRFRTCTDPPPSDGGNPCVGEATDSEEQKCNIRDCLKYGSWTPFEFENWTECSATCDQGYQFRGRSRTCTLSVYYNKSNICRGPGYENEKRVCNTHPCPSGTSGVLIGIASSASIAFIAIIGIVIVVRICYRRKIESNNDFYEQTYASIIESNMYQGKAFQKNPDDASPYIEIIEYNENRPYYARPTDASTKEDGDYLKPKDKTECPYDNFKNVGKDESQNDQRENVCHTSEVETNTEDENTAEINVDIEEEQMTTRV